MYLQNSKCLMMECMEMEAGDGIYGIDAMVDARDMQYYIYAENNDAGVFSPERAEHEYHYLPVVSDLVINELMAII